MEANLKSGVLVAGLLLLTTGCFPHDYRRVNVTVIDGETGAAVPQAAVLAPAGEWGAAAHHAQTDSLGKATLQEAVGVMAEAPGYLPSPVVGPVKSNDGAPLKEWSTLIKLYRSQEPIVGLSFPEGFRGLVRVMEGEANSRTPRHTPPLDGTSEFYTEVNPEGITTTIPPPLLSNNQSYRATVMCARFKHGPLLRFENPTARTGSNGEHVCGLPDIRDRVAPSPDGVAMFDLGLCLAPHPDYARVFFVGTAAEAQVAKQDFSEMIRAKAATQPAGRIRFRPSPLSIDDLEVGTELSPRFRADPSDPDSASPRR